MLGGAPRFWESSVTPVPPPSAANPTLKFLVYAAVVTGTWSGLLSLLIYGIGRLIGVEYDAVQPGSQVIGAVTGTLMLVVPIIAALIAALLSSLLLGRPHARQIVFWAGTGIAAASLAIPLAFQPGQVAWSTRMWLAVPHILTWFLVVPQLARIVGDSEPGMSVDRSE